MRSSSSNRLHNSSRHAGLFLNSPRRVPGGPWLSASVAVNLLLLLGILLVYPQIRYHYNTLLRAQDEEASAQMVQVDRQLQELQSQLQPTQAALERVKETIAAQAQVPDLQQQVAALKLQLAAEANTSSALRTDLSTLAHAAPDGRAWLTIGIPTIPRKTGADYLTRTLGTLMEELPLDPTEPLYKRVRVLVMNNRPGNHTVFYKVKQRLTEALGPGDFFAHKAKLYISFVDNPGTVPDPKPELKDPDDFNNPSNRPGREVRRQTCDLVTLMDVAEPLSHYFMFMEDDFRVCPNALRIIQYAVQKLNTVPMMQRWLALRVSYGMNGILMRAEHLASLNAYMRKHTARLPPDLIWLEWFNGRRPELRSVVRGRPLAVYRSNLLDHIGAQSSFAVRTTRPKWPGCFDSMAGVWSLHKTERFQLQRCPHSDLSPCPKDPSWLVHGDTWTRYPIDFPNILEGIEQDHPEDHLADTLINSTGNASIQLHI